MGKAPCILVAHLEGSAWNGKKLFPCRKFGILVFGLKATGTNFDIGKWVLLSSD